MTWEKMIEIETRLQQLYEKAAGYTREKGFCANRVWYQDGLKNELLNLVGYGAKHIQLSSDECYDIAYQKIYNALPNCNHEHTFC